MGQIWSGSSKKGLPKTGQLIPYVDYDDGYYQKGLPLSGDRFKDNGDGTISDNTTGLQWIKQPELIIPGTNIITSNQIQVAHGAYANAHAYNIGDLVTSTLYYVCVIPHTSNGASVTADLVNNPASWIQTVWINSAANLTTPATMTWATAITNCEALIYAGHNDWYLPNIKELQSIVDYSAVSPAINGTFFPNCQSDYYWSSTTFAVDTDIAWYVSFGGGGVGNGGKGFTYYVRPVRSSQ